MVADWFEHKIEIVPDILLMSTRTKRIIQEFMEETTAGTYDGIAIITTDLLNRPQEGSTKG